MERRDGAEFTNLPYAAFTFEVQARALDGRTRARGSRCCATGSTRISFSTHSPPSARSAPRAAIERITDFCQLTLFRREDDALPAWVKSGAKAEP